MSVKIREQKKTSKMQQKRKENNCEMCWALTATVEPFLPLPPVIKI